MPDVSSIGQRATRFASVELAVTTAVAADVAVPEPLLFVAVTTTRIVWPTSPVTSTYVEPVATATHAAPVVSHRRHE